MNPLRLIAALPATLGVLTATAQISWQSTEHDFGSFAEEAGSVTTEFTFVNESSRPIVILSAQASCGCTRPSYPKGSIQPGDTAHIAVTYNPMGRPGRFDKSVKVKTDASPETFKLKIKGVVIGSPKTVTTNYPVECGRYSLKNTVINFGDITYGRTKNKFAEGYNLSPDSIRPRVAGLPSYIDADVAPRVVGPGVQFIVSFFYNGTRAAGVYGHDLQRVALSLDDGVEPCQISLIANVTEDFSRLTDSQRANAPVIAVSTSSVDLSTVTRGEKAKATVTIDNYGRSDLILRRLQTADDDSALTIHAKKSKIKKGGSTSLEITVDTSRLPADAKYIDLHATIIANDPDHPTTPLRIVGELK